jgi:PhoPQ-activated pathogenicity-related protein
VWWHELYIIVPNNLNKNENGFFYIDGGRNDVPGYKPFYLEHISNLSTQCNCITAIIKQIPNQPIKFTARMNN